MLTRADLLDERDAALEEAAAAKRALAEAGVGDGARELTEMRARAEHAEERATQAEAAVENVTDQLIDVLAVLARWGIDIDRDQAGALVEYALLQVDKGPCRASCRRWTA